MDQHTKGKSLNEDFDKLHKELSSTHKPIKANIADEYLISIGRILVKFQRLENTISSFIHISIDLDPRLGSIITSKLSFGNLLKVLRSIHLELSNETGELDVLITEATKAEEIRNQIVHSLWVGGRNRDVEAVRFKTIVTIKKGLKFSNEQYSIEDLNEICDWIDKIDTSFDALRWKFLEEHSV